MATWLDLLIDVCCCCCCCCSDSWCCFSFVFLLLLVAAVIILLVLASNVGKNNLGVQFMSHFLYMERNVIVRKEPKYEFFSSNRHMV